MYPWVAQTRSAPVASMAASRLGQSTWSDTVKPRSTARRRRMPRMAIQPDANAVDCAPNRRAHGRAIRRGRRDHDGAAASRARSDTAAWVVGGSATPPAR